MSDEEDASQAFDYQAEQAFSLQGSTFKGTATKSLVRGIKMVDEGGPSKPLSPNTEERSVITLAKTGEASKESKSHISLPKAKVRKIQIPLLNIQN